jgi:hypothetical protein
LFCVTSSLALKSDVMKLCSVWDGSATEDAAPAIPVPYSIIERGQSLTDETDNSCLGKHHAVFVAVFWQFRQRGLLYTLLL